MKAKASVFGAGLAFFLLVTPAESNQYLPESSFRIKRDAYELLYDGRTKNAIWVYENICSDSFEGQTAKRQGLSFKQDPSIPDHLRAQNNDYKGKKFERGHLCPFADCRSTSSAAAETFFLSNASPQEPSLNRGAWARLEKYVRELSVSFEQLHIITMPLFIPSEEGGKTVLHYEVLGEHRVAVPTHFCKVIFAENAKQLAAIFAYLLPNASIERQISLESFRTTLAHIEEVAGVAFIQIPDEFRYGLTLEK